MSSRSLLQLPFAFQYEHGFLRRLSYLLEHLAIDRRATRSFKFHSGINVFYFEKLRDTLSLSVDVLMVHLAEPYHAKRFSVVRMMRLHLVVAAASFAVLLL